LATIDERDKKIIGLLKADSRMSIRDIAKHTGMRPSTVHQRIQKLRRDKVIERFTIRLDPKKTDENFVVFLLISTREDLDDKFLNHSCIKDVYGITGEFDLFMKLKFKDVDEFNSFLITFRKDKRIKKTLTMVGTISLKETL